MPVEVYRCILIIALRVDRSAWYKQQNQNEPANSPTTPHDSSNEFDNRSRITRVKKLTPLPHLSQPPTPHTYSRRPEKKSALNRLYLTTFGIYRVTGPRAPPTSANRSDGAGGMCGL